MKDNLFNIETMALIDGGTIQYNKYCGTEVGIAVERHPFTMEIFTEEKIIPELQDMLSSCISIVKVSQLNIKFKMENF